VLPLKVRERILGTLTLVSSAAERRYQQADLELAEELARRAAMAIDNALLYREAQRAIRLRDDFLSIASHELRTPLTSMMLSLQFLQHQLAQQASATATMVRLLEGVTRQGQRLNRQVDDLFDVARIEAGRLWLRPVDMDLAELVRDVVGSFEFGLKRAGCEVTLDAPESVWGRWDRSRLEQVVSNLLSNAMKFGAGRPIEISVHRQDESAILVVADHGIGIDVAHQQHIFERFVREVSSAYFGGLGLGLYICREIVSAHRGTIRVESKLDEGATFTVELPLWGEVVGGNR
jgi:signal transduction histidine kinase